MKNNKMSNETQGLLNNDDYVILDNPLASPKFIRALKRGEYEPLSLKDTYTPKLFYEIVSRINTGLLEGVKNNENIIIEVQTKEFAQDIGAMNNGNFYTDIKNVAEYLSDIKIVFKGLDGLNTRVGVVTKTKTDEKGKIVLYVDSELATRILEVKEKSNFSFLKSNLFRLQNGQAIRLYPFFKSWLNKGRYETDLKRFKVQFGYDTKGYDRFNRFEKFVLEPATEEINAKTDIIIKYELTGDNIGGARPRIKGLIFYITAKDKAKQLPTGERHQTVAPQPETTTTPLKTKPIEKSKPQTGKDKPSEADLVVLGERLKLNQNQIQTIIGELKGDYIRTFEVLQGCINENKAKTINSPFAYIITSLTTLGIGLYEQEQVKAQKKEAERIEKEKQATIEKIQREYQERKTKQFTELYNKATDAIKQGFLQDFKPQTKNGYNPYINQQGEIKPSGIYKIGEALAEAKGIGLEQRQSKFRNEVFEKYSYQIGYDEHDQVVILGLFENVEQTPPQGQEPQRTAEQLTENKKKYQAQKRQPKTAAPKTEKPQAIEKTPPAPMLIQEPIKEEPTTQKPKSFFQKIFG
jgi:plasmid replication initiation protein